MIWEWLRVLLSAFVSVVSEHACPGTTFCRLAKQDALNIGLTLDERYHGFERPGKLKMSASGCTLTVGGNVGAQPRIGQALMKGLKDDQALAVVEKVLQYYKVNAKKGERLGMLIDRLGFDSLKTAVHKGVSVSSLFTHAPSYSYG